jgi:hypothetical protein
MLYGVKHTQLAGMECTAKSLYAQEHPISILFGAAGVQS